MTVYTHNTRVMHYHFNVSLPANSDVTPRSFITIIIIIIQTLIKRIYILNALYTMKAD